MSEFASILAVVQKPEDAEPVLSKACQLMDAQESKLTVTRVVYEGLADLRSKDVGTSPDLKDLILQAETEELTELVRRSVDATPFETTVAWNRKSWEGIVGAADATGAGIIVKAVEQRNELSVRTPDDWNLLREARIPVLLVKPNRWKPNPQVLVALDVLDPLHEALNLRVLAQANELCRQLAGTLHVASAYPCFEPWSTRLGLLQSYSKLRKEIAHDVAVAVSRLIRSIGGPEYEVHCIEDTPESGIERISEQVDADVVVIGSNAREGLEAAFLGNTAEKILHRVDIDTLTVT